MIRIKKISASIVLSFCVITSVSAAAAKIQIASPSPQHLAILKQAELIGPVEPDTPINLTVWFKLNNQSDLEHLINELYDPNSPKYQNFLSKEAFDRQFGPTTEAMKEVRNYFSNQGLQAEFVQNPLEVNATAEQINRIFHIKLNNYRYQGKIIYANSEGAWIDADIAKNISYIMGLDDIPLFGPLYKKGPSNASFAPKAGTHKMISNFTGAEIGTAYNVAGIAPVRGTPINGANQTIFASLTCANDTNEKIIADANAFNQANGLPLFNDSNFSIINETGGPAPPINSPGCNSGWAFETALDIQALHAMAPLAKIVLVLAKNAGGGLITADNYISQNYPGAIVSHSWGAIEGGTFPNYTPILQQAAAQGQSFVYSTGDSGDYIRWNGPPAKVQHPASNTYAIAVGGSSLYADADCHYVFEGGWGEYRPNVVTDANFFGGGGGGISPHLPAMASQVATIGGLSAGGYPGVISDTSCMGTQCRALPDIAMIGDPYTGLMVYFGPTCLKKGCSVAGTSLAAPLFAGTIALVNQARELINNGYPKPIGLITPYLYTQNALLKKQKALRVVNPPHFFIPGTFVVPNYPNAFRNNDMVFNVDSSLTIQENQFWNDVVGVGTPNVPNFVRAFSTL